MLQQFRRNEFAFSLQRSPEPVRRSSRRWNRLPGNDIFFDMAGLLCIYLLTWAKKNPLNKGGFEIPLNNRRKTLRQRLFERGKTECSYAVDHASPGKSTGIIRKAQISDQAISAQTRKTIAFDKAAPSAKHRKRGGMAV